MSRSTLGSLVRRVARYAVAYLALAAVLLVGILVYDAFSAIFEVRHVATGSMEPSFPRGSLIVVYKDVYGISLGDPVMFRHPQAPRYAMFHRVVAMENGRIYTKGDAVDRGEVIGYEHVVGVFIFGIPYIMRLRDMLVSDPLFTYLLCLLLVAVAVLAPEERRGRAP